MACIWKANFCEIQNKFGVGVLLAREMSGTEEQKHGHQLRVGSIRREWKPWAGALPPTSWVDLKARPAFQ